MDQLAKEAFEFTKTKDPAFLERRTHITYLLVNLKGVEVIQLGLGSEHAPYHPATYHTTIIIDNLIVDPLINYLYVNEDVARLRFDPQGKYVFPLCDPSEIPFSEKGKPVETQLKIEQIAEIFRDYPISNIISAFRFAPYDLMSIQADAQRAGLTRRLYIFETYTDAVLKVLEEEGLIRRGEVVREPDVLKNWMPFGSTNKPALAHIFNNQMTKRIFVDERRRERLLEQQEGYGIIPALVIIRPVRSESLHNNLQIFGLIEYGIEVKKTQVTYGAHHEVRSACQEIEAALQKRKIPYRTA